MQTGQNCLITSVLKGNHWPVVVWENKLFPPKKQQQQQQIKVNEITNYVPYLGLFLG